MIKENIAVIVLFLFCFCSLAVGQPTDVVESYLTALKAQRFDDAAGHWEKAVLRQAQRLGIVYDSIPVKYDCASPVAEMTNDLASGEVTFSVREKSMKKGYAEVSAVFRTAIGSFTHPYYLRKTDDLWLITRPPFLYADSWHADTTTYTVVRSAHDSLVNRFALAAMDSFIETTATELGCDANDLSRLKSAKLLYYLCGEKEIVTLAGYDTQGMSSLPIDAVISRHLPHPHEITHELVNYRLKELPLYTLPFMQEGLATWLGGRWARSPRVIRFAGNVIFDYELVEPEVLLTFSGFHKDAGGADISYPAAALFTGYLYETLGLDRFFDLYRALSGGSQAVREMNRGAVIETLEKHTGLGWDDLVADFHEFRKQYAASGLRPGGSGDIERAGKEYTLATRTVRMLTLPDRTEFLCELPQSGGWSVLLFDTRDTVSSSYRSRLFAEHLPNETYTGQHYGLRFSGDETGLYDYWTNTLLANYVSSLTPSPDYEDEEAQTVWFSVPHAILDMSGFTPVRLFSDRPAGKEEN